MTVAEWRAAPTVGARRAIEALRSGVPSRDAVAALGTSQDEAEDEAMSMLGRLAWPARAVDGRRRGVLLGGGFGTGKSHLMKHLARLAVDAGWAVSTVVISKETPLHDPAKVLRAAVESAELTATAPGQALEEITREIDLDGTEFAELRGWSCSPRAALDERFEATLALFAKVRENDANITNQLVRFWSGDPLKVSDLRRWLREYGVSAPQLRAVPARELARQRIRFLARLFAAAGKAGWLLLFDEAELIARYPLLSRARSYAELAWWLTGDGDDAEVPLAVVVAMTDDFAAAVLKDRDDRAKAPQRLRAKQTPEFDELAGLAETGMRAIERDMIRLHPPDRRELDELYERLRQMHGEAFGWDPPDVPGLELLGATPMRLYVRAWINEWDLVRLDPEFTPSTTAVPLSVNFREAPELEEQDES